MDLISLYEKLLHLTHQREISWYGDGDAFVTWFKKRKLRLSPEGLEIIDGEAAYRFPFVANHRDLYDAVGEQQLSVAAWVEAVLEEK